MKRFLMCALICVLVLPFNLNVFAQNEALLSKPLPPLEEVSEYHGVNLSDYPYYNVLGSIKEVDGVEVCNWLIMVSMDPTLVGYLGGGKFCYYDDNERTIVFLFQTPIDNTSIITSYNYCYRTGVKFGADVVPLYTNYDLLLNDTTTSNVTTVMFYNPYRLGASGSYWNRFINPNNIPTDSSSDNSGILSWLSNIFDKISDGFSNLGDKISSGFTNLINSITNLPTLIWSMFESGFETLFVPDREFIQDNFTSWQQLFSDRFGAVYQAYEYLFGFVKKFVYQEAATHVTFPTVTVPLSGSEFTFGGFDVLLIPEGFSGIVEILKGLIDLVCTIAFVNTLKSKFVELLGGYQDAN